MGSKCVVCHERPAAHRCIQCHKPTCDECAFKTEHGVFCGRECAAQYRDFRRAEGPRVRKSSPVVKLIILVLAVLAALGVAVHLGYIELGG